MNRRAQQRGQTIVEFALIAPIVFLLLFVIVDFGIAMDRRIVLQHAVREGARYGAVTDNQALICKRTYCQAQEIAKDIEISYEDIDGNGTKTDAGDAVDVKINFTYDPVLIRPIFSGLFGGTIGQIEMHPTGSFRLDRTVSGGAAGKCPAQTLVCP